MRSKRTVNKPDVFAPTNKKNIHYVTYGEHIIAVLVEGKKSVMIRSVNTGEDVEGRSVFVEPRADIDAQYVSISQAVDVVVREWNHPIGVTA